MCVTGYSIIPLQQCKTILELGFWVDLTRQTLRKTIKMKFILQKGEKINEKQANVISVNLKKCFLSLILSVSHVETDMSRSIDP